MKDHNKSSVSLLPTLLTAFLSAMLLLVVLPAPAFAQSPGGTGGSSDSAAMTEGTRVALVIGNGEYQHTSPLANPVNDATDVASTLNALGFETQLVTNAGNADMARSIQGFLDTAERRDADTALFYYAGHGVQFEGVNYLLPVNADIQDNFELLDKAQSMDRVTLGLERAGTRFNLIMLDACRDNPFASTRSGSRGLSVMGGTGGGSMVVFATAPGDVAQDGDGRNSPFTQAFLEHVTTPNLEVTQLMKNVQRSVQEYTNGRQIPWVNTSFTGEFFFASAERQLARSQEQAEALQSELAALEAEIAEREAAISAATSAEERRRLEAEQQRARAEEEAKRLEAERLAELEAQAEEVLASRQAQEALRREMEDRMAAQQASLTRRAEERREELQRLREESMEQAGFYSRLETIAQIQQAIADIDARFDQTIRTTLTELETLHTQEIEGFREANPRDPWETPEEYQERIAGELKKLEEQYQADREAQQRDLQRRRVAETEDLLAQLAEAKAELNGMRFTVGAEATRVVVDDFDPYEKHFPIQVRVTDEHVPFTVPLFYRIDSRDRQVLRDQYYRVFSADQAGGLAGELEYAVYEVYSDIWAVRPVQTKVVNLLQEDAVLVGARGSGADKPNSLASSVQSGTEAGDAGLVTSGGGEILYRTNGTVERIYGVLPVRATSNRDGEAELYVDGEKAGTIPQLLIANTSREGGTKRLRCRWDNRTTINFRVNLGAGLNPAVGVRSDRSEPEREGTVLITNIPPDSQLQGLGSGNWYDVSRTNYMLPAPPGQDVVIRLKSKWLADEVQVPVSGHLTAASVAWVDLTAADLAILGRLAVSVPEGRIALFNGEGEAALQEPVETFRQEAAYEIPLPPGQYTIGAALTDDPYLSRVETVTVSPAQEVGLTLSGLKPSTRWQLDQAQASHDRIRQQLSKKGVRRGLGWTMLAAGLSGVAGSVYSYLEVQNATEAYNSAATTSTARDYREQVQDWGTIMDISIGVGAGGTALGGVFLVTSGGRSGLIRERNEMERRIDALSAEVASEQARNALIGRKVQ